eukprot:363950-Chlamydomonas_euryale.AAC.10
MRMWKTGWLAGWMRLGRSRERSWCVCAFMGTSRAALMRTPGAALMRTPGAALMGAPGAALMRTPGATLMRTPGAALMGTPGAALMGTPGAALMGTPGAELTGAARSRAGALSNGLSQAALCLFADHAVTAAGLLASWRHNTVPQDPLEHRPPGPT